MIDMKYIFICEMCSVNIGLSNPLVWSEEVKVNDERMILLNESDNVFVCRQKINKGDLLQIGTDRIEMGSDIDVGHKIAGQAISMGNKILKYGVSIGSATKNISKGDHVHIHNMKSDYIASHDRQRRNKG